MLVKFEKRRASTGDVEVSIQNIEGKPRLRVLIGALGLLDEMTGQRVKGVHLCGDTDDKASLYIVPTSDPDGRKMYRTETMGTISPGDVFDRLNIELPTVTLRLPASWDATNNALKVSLASVQRVMEHIKSNPVPNPVKGPGKPETEGDAPEKRRPGRPKGSGKVEPIEKRGPGRPRTKPEPVTPVARQPRQPRSIRVG